MTYFHCCSDLYSYLNTTSLAGHREGECHTDSIDYDVQRFLKKLILCSKMQVFFEFYTESPWMWRHFGDMNLRSRVDILSHGYCDIP